MVLPVLREGEEAFTGRCQQETLHSPGLEKQDRRFIGINNFGIRLRHTTFNHWLEATGNR